VTNCHEKFQCAGKVWKFWGGNLYIGISSEEHRKSSAPLSLALFRSLCMESTEITTTRVTIQSVNIILFTLFVCRSNAVSSFGFELRRYAHNSNHSVILICLSQINTVWPSAPSFGIRLSSSCS